MANTIQNQLEKKEDRKSIRSLIKDMEGEIAKALPSVITPERFTRITLTALSANPMLQKCDAKTFLGAMMQAAQLGVEVNTNLGQAYIIPYFDGKTKIYNAQFQLGYKGLVDLAYRSGEVQIIQSHIVYENDEFTYEYGIDPKLSHKPCMGDRGNPICVYAMFKTKDGGFGFEVMSMDECRKHAEKYSKAYTKGSSPWQTSFEEMCKKTALKRVLKLAPMKSDFVRAAAADETIKSNISSDMYAEPDQTVYEAESFEDKTDTVEDTNNG